VSPAVRVSEPLVSLEAGEAKTNLNASVVRPTALLHKCLVVREGSRERLRYKLLVLGCAHVGRQDGVRAGDAILDRAQGGEDADRRSAGERLFGEEAVRLSEIELDCE
jgi:hypothetical protein